MKGTYVESRKNSLYAMCALVVCWSHRTRSAQVRMASITIAASGFLRRIERPRVWMPKPRTAVMCKSHLEDTIRLKYPKDLDKNKKIGYKCSDLEEFSPIRGWAKALGKHQSIRVSLTQFRYFEGRPKSIFGSRSLVNNYYRHREMQWPRGYSRRGQQVDEGKVCSMNGTVRPEVGLG